MLTRSCSTGEAEINAASTVMALMLSDVFDFSKTVRALASGV